MTPFARASMNHKPYIELKVVWRPWAKGGTSGPRILLQGPATRAEALRVCRLISALCGAKVNLDEPATKRVGQRRASVVGKRRAP